MIKKNEFEIKNEPVPRILSGYGCCLSQRSPPLKLLFLLSALASLLVDHSKAFSLFLNMRRIHVIENWYHNLAKFFPAFDDLHQLIQAPAGTCVVIRERDNRDPRSSNGVDQLRGNGSAFYNLIVLEGSD